MLFPSLFSIGTPLTALCTCVNITHMFFVLVFLFLLQTHHRASRCLPPSLQGLPSCFPLFLAQHRGFRLYLLLMVLLERPLALCHRAVTLVYCCPPVAPRLPAAPSQLVCITVFKQFFARAVMIRLQPWRLFFNLRSAQLCSQALCLVPSDSS